MERRMRSKVFIFSTVVVILLVCAAVLLLYNLGIIGRNGLNTGDVDGTDMNAASLPEVTLTFGLPGFKPANADEILNELQKRTAKELNIKLNFKWNDMTHAKTENYIRAWNDSDTQYDAYCLADFLSIEQDIKKALKDGFIMDVKELFPRYAPKYFKKFATEELLPSTYEEKLCIIPNYTMYTSRRYAIVRDDLMKKYNIPEIKNYDDFDAYLTAVKKNESGVVPLYLNITNDPRIPYVYDTTLKLFADLFGYVIADYGLGIVYKWNDPEMKLTVWEQTPEYEEAVGRLIKWRSSGFCEKDGKYFDMGKYASIIVNKSDMLDMTRNASIGSNFDKRFRIIDLYPDKVAQRSTGIYSGIAISAKSKHPERVLMFIEWLQSNQDNYDLLLYGIKGKNYVLYGDQLGFPKDGETDELTYINWTGHHSFMNVDNERTNMMLPPDFKKSLINEVVTKSKFAPHAGYMFDIESVKDIAAQRIFSYCAVEETIRTGSFTDKTIDDYISDQKKKDVGKLLSTLQKQLDDWKVANKK